MEDYLDYIATTPHILIRICNDYLFHLGTIRQTGMQLLHLKHRMQIL
jgi:hypothetical protein